MDDPNPRLIEAVIQLDDRACTDLLGRCAGLIQAAITQAGFFSGDPRDLEEMLSRVSHEVIRSIGNWDADRGAFSTWVYGVARNVVNSFRREQKRRERAGRTGNEVSFETVGPTFDPPETVRPQPGEEVTPSDMEVAFWRVYADMPEEDQRVVDHMVEGAPHRELAEDLKTSEEAVRMRVSRMRKKLAQAVAGELGIEPPS